jgi:hypothetical protein
MITRLLSAHKKAPPRGGALTFQCTTRWIAVSSGWARAKIYSKSPPSAPGVSRRHEHLLLAAETLEPVSSGRIIKARVSLHAFVVPDSYKKFAAAFTRARVDYPSFLFLSLPLCTLRISCECAYFLRPHPKYGGGESLLNKNLCLRLLKQARVQRIVPLLRRNSMSYLTDSTDLLRRFWQIGVSI